MISWLLGTQPDPRQEKLNQTKSDLDKTCLATDINFMLMDLGENDKTVKRLNRLFKSLHKALRDTKQPIINTAIQDGLYVVVDGQGLVQVVKGEEIEE